MLKKKTYKNYKELCNDMGWKVCGGNQKISQMKDLERFCKYHKEGNKFVIDELFNKPLEKQENKRNSIYAEYIDKLILNMCSELYNSDYNYIELSPSLLMQKLHMSNKNFSYGRNNINKFSRWLEIPIETIYDFYNSTYKKNKDIIESSLNRFKRKSLIDYDKDVVKVCTINNEYRRATDKEREYIKEVEQEIFKQIGYEDKKDIFLHGEWNSFRKKKNEYLKEIGILYDFSVYHIITTKKFRSMILEEKEYNEISNKLNLDIQKSAEKSAIKRHDSTIDKYTTKVQFGKNNFTTPIWDKDKNRVTNKYIDDTRKVIAICIDKFNTLDLSNLLISIPSEKYTFIEDVMNDNQWVEYCNLKDLNDLFG